MGTRFATGLPAGPALQLQRCELCGKVNYPRRELCAHCLADALHWCEVESGGGVRSVTELHYSLEPLFAERLPWRIASVQLDCGPVAFVHLQPGLVIGARVDVRIAVDAGGNRVVVALDEGGENAREWLVESGFQEESA
mgnify:CR=1 FL=1